MLTKLLTPLPAALLLFVFVQPGRASLVGSSVTGSLTFAGDPSNYFNPGYGFVPTENYLNAAGTTVAVSDGAIEFGYDDGASLISADFSDNSFTLSDLIEMSGSINSFQTTFTDAAFAGQSLSLVSGNFPLAGYSLVGDVITLNYAGGNPTMGQMLTANFAFGALAPTPEPSTLGLLAMSALAAALATFFVRNFRLAA